MRQLSRKNKAVSSGQKKFDLKQWAKNTNERPSTVKKNGQYLKCVNKNFEELQQDSTTQTLGLCKLKYIADDEQTKKVPINKIKLDAEKNVRKTDEDLKPIHELQMNNQQSLQIQTKTINKLDLAPKIHKFHKDLLRLDIEGPHNQASNDFIPSIPYNKKADQIMNKRPLRERMQGLLPPNIALPISFDHQELLKRMQIIDRTISFLISHRGLKVIFLSNIKKSIAESSHIFIEQSTIKQLMYLDEKCYNLEWKMNDKIKKYDLKLSLPENIGSMDSRKILMRKNIVKYLLAKQAQMLINLGQSKIQAHKWHPKFQYQKISIPQMNLPVHPLVQNADLRTCPKSQINKIENPLLKSIIRAKKEKSEVKSLSKASVADMIFSRMPASEISERLLSTIKQKQKKNLQETAESKQFSDRIEAETCLKVVRQILMVYLGKNVSNIFRVTLLEMLCKRLKFKDTIIEASLNKILEVSSQEQFGNSGKIEKIGFLKQIESSKKIKVIQMNRQKIKQIEEYFQREIDDKLQ